MSNKLLKPKIPPTLNRAFTVFYCWSAKGDIFIRTKKVPGLGKRDVRVTKMIEGQNIIHNEIYFSNSSTIYTETEHYFEIIY